MSKIKVTLPEYPVNGKQISFVAPCVSGETECLIIHNNVFIPLCTDDIPAFAVSDDDGNMVTVEQYNEEYSIVDADGVSVAGLPNIWNKGAIISVILNTVTKTAYIQNANTNPYLEDKFKTLENRFTALEYMYLNNDFFAPLCTDNGPSFVITDDNGNVVVADWKYVVQER